MSMPSADSSVILPSWNDLKSHIKFRHNLQGRQLWIHRTKDDPTECTQYSFPALPRTYYTTPVTSQQ